MGSCGYLAINTAGGVMRYVAKIKVAGKTLHLGYFSRKSEADIVFKAAATDRNNCMLVIV